MSTAATILNLIGLVSATAGSALMLSFEIRERAARSKKTTELARIKNQIAAREHTLREVVRLTIEANRLLDPEHDRYNIEAATKPIREQLEQLQNSLAKLEDINQEVLDNLLPLAHPFAYLLLVLGFISQMLALAF